MHNIGYIFNNIATKKLVLRAFHNDNT